MKFDVRGDKIAEAVFRAEKATGKNTSLPVLKCILFDANREKLLVRATNLDLGIEISIDIKTKEEGVVAVPGDVLSGFLNSIPKDESVSIGTKGNTLSVNTKRSSVEFTTYSSEDFPTFPKITNTQKVVLPSQQISNGLKSVWYSASSSSMKPELSSVFITAQDGEIIFAATDSFRLSEKRIRNKKINDFEPLLVPIKNINEIIRNIETASEDEEIKVVFNENQAVFEIGDTLITSRVIDGTFPDYKQIIPKEFIAEVIVLKQDIVDALKISNIFTNRFNQTTLSLKPKKKEFSIKTSNPERGSSTVSVDAALSGEDLDIGFNYKYLTDSFQALNTDSITLHFSGVGKPLVMTGVGDTTFTYLVMPMNR